MRSGGNQNALLVFSSLRVTECNLAFWLNFFYFFKIEETESGQCLWRTPGGWRSSMFANAKAKIQNEGGQK
jgi:hypothetical protein